jgi:uncharacterized membrane protein YoaK (UPF0700 family)
MKKALINSMPYIRFKGFFTKHKTANFKQFSTNLFNFFNIKVSKTQAGDLAD